VYAVPRPQRSGERGRANAVVPATSRGTQRAPAPVAPVVRLSRSAPTILREADLRAIIAGQRSVPGGGEMPPRSRSYAQRQQVVNITYSVVQQPVAQPTARRAASPSTRRAMVEAARAAAADVEADKRRAFVLLRDLIGGPS
jgi:hypothetical protein